MESNAPRRLVGSEIHGFHTLEELDVGNIMEEAKTRWLRPNEIHAILCNHKYFTIYVKPVNLPPGGTIVLFDRKMLRNFRKDGHNWKKKNDGKTVKEAHEHLKVGDEERIHVYYAHGQDNPTFVRRCYWLLDKRLENIVLVHYRETQESQGSPIAPVNSTASSAHSEPSASWLLSDDSDSVVDQAYYTSEKAVLEPEGSIQNHEIKLHEINTLDWDELVVSDDPNKLITPEAGIIAGYEQQNQYEMHGCRSNGNSLSANIHSAENISSGNFTNVVAGKNSDHIYSSNVMFGTVAGQIGTNLQTNGTKAMPIGTGESLDTVNKDDLQSQDSFGRWMTYIMTDSPDSVLTNDLNLESSISTGQEISKLTNHQQLPNSEQLFSITDVSPASALSTQETKILIIGFFHEVHSPLAKSNLFCVCGDECVPAELIQSGVYRCFVSPHKPGLVNLYLSLDGNKPISQVVTFEYNSPLTSENFVDLSEDKPRWEDFRYQMRLAHLLFSTSKRFNNSSVKPTQNALKEAKVFAHKTSQIADSWTSLLKSIEDNKFSYPRAKDSLFEVALQNRLQEWLLEKIVEGCKISDHDNQGQGVIHLCAILGYTWAVYQFSLSGLSLDYRDKFGWTALHWAAYCGREDMVAALLSAGAKPNLVTDPTSENPGGCTPADLASMNGYDGLAAYLAEKGLVQQLKDMTIAGNVSGSLQMTRSNSVCTNTFTEEELYLKDTLAAYRTAADAAARIQSAFRERSLKVQKEAIQSSNAEDEARNIIAAMKIQHAFRKHDTRKKILAAAHIQHRFRTWKMRKDFLDLRRQTIKIQAIFRGFQVRKQYRKIIFAVGVLEKAVLRWRLKRKGFRGLQVPDKAAKDQEQEIGVEDFFQASRKQAEDRVERSVVRVQAIFRSKRSQEAYRRMKLAHNRATLEYEGLLKPDTDMG